MDDRKYQCPCCGCLTLSVPKAWGICPVCFWEDEGGIYDGGVPREDIMSVPNHMTLARARENFRKFGACDERMIPNVRKPAESEITDTYRALIDPPPES